MREITVLDCIFDESFTINELSSPYLSGPRQIFLVGGGVGVRAHPSHPLLRTGLDANYLEADEMSSGRWCHLTDLGKTSLFNTFQLSPIHHVHK